MNGTDTSEPETCECGGKGYFAQELADASVLIMECDTCCVYASPEAGPIEAAMAYRDEFRPGWIIGWEAVPGSSLGQPERAGGKIEIAGAGDVWVHPTDGPFYVSVDDEEE